MEKIFKDLKIIELAGVLAGPGVGLFFAELGAKVIKIENKKTGGDVTRKWKLKTEDPSKNTSAYFWSVNAKKKSVFLDLTGQTDREWLYKQVKGADIVITNYKKGDDKKLKVDYSTLKKINPGLIYASISGFGLNSNRTAFDLILQAETGYMFMNGQKHDPPTKMPVALIDIITGHQLKEAILIALLKKQKTNKGSHVSASLFDGAITSLTNQATNWLIGKHLPVAAGSLHPNISPYGEIFETKDKHMVTFAVGSDRQFHELCSILKLDKANTDKHFDTNQKRVKNRSELFKVMATGVKKIQFRNLFNECMKHEIPMGKIRNMKEVFELPEARKLRIPIKEDNKTIYAVSSIGFKFHP